MQARPELPWPACFIHERRSKARECSLSCGKGRIGCQIQVYGKALPRLTALGAYQTDRHGLELRTRMGLRYAGGQTRKLVSRTGSWIGNADASTKERSGATVIRCTSFPKARNHRVQWTARYDTSAAIEQAITRCLARGCAPRPYVNHYQPCVCCVPTWYGSGDSALLATHGDCVAFAQHRS